MQNVASLTTVSQPSSLVQSPQDRSAPPLHNSLAHYQIIRRNGAVVPFEPSKVTIATMKAFLAVHGTQGAASASVRETV